MKLLRAFIQCARGKRGLVRMAAQFEQDTDYIAFSADHFSTILRRWRHYRALGYR